MSHNGASLSEPRSIVQSLTTKFQAAADVAAVQKIDAAFDRVQTVRAQKLAASRDSLHQWMKKVEGAKWEAQRPADRSENAHAERMAQLDRDRYVLAKAVNELELGVQQEEATWNQIRERLSSIKHRCESLHSKESTFSEDRVRSMVYREMGLSWAIDDVQVDSQGRWENSDLKCRIVSHKNNDVFTVVFEPRSNLYQDAARLWSLIS